MHLLSHMELWNDPSADAESWNNPFLLPPFTSFQRNEVQIQWNRYSELWQSLSNENIHPIFKSCSKLNIYLSYIKV